MEEDCTHDVIFHGMCAHCGSPAEEDQAAKQPTNSLVRPGHVSRDHDLLVTRDKAEKLGNASTKSTSH